MDMMLTAYGEDEEINISVPINKIIKEHWKGSTPPDVLTVSTGLGDEVAQASFVLDEESSSHQSIALSTENKKTCRQCYWFRLELAKNHQKALVASCMAATMQPRTMVLWQPSETAHVTDMTVHAAFFG